MAREQVDMNLANLIIHEPVDGYRFRDALRAANKATIHKAVKCIGSLGGRNSTRIAACERRLYMIRTRRTTNA